jgi:hypothetical protein
MEERDREYVPMHLAERKLPQPARNGVLRSQKTTTLRLSSCSLEAIFATMKNSDV